MTREEAIKILKELAGYEKTMDLIQNYSVSVQDALYMAIKELEQEPCDKCVYSTSEGCQYDDITETIPPFETSDDAISRQAVLKIIDGWYEQNRDTDNIEDLIVFITYMDSVNPQKPICPSAGVDCEDCPAYEKKSEWEHDHEILKAYSDGANAVLDEIRAEIEKEIVPKNSDQYDYEAKWQNLGLRMALKVIDKYKAEGSDE